MFNINEAVNELRQLVNLGNGGSTSRKLGASTYPSEIIFIQNEKLEYYIKKLNLLYVGFHTDLYLQGIIDWQVRQVYRLVNAMLASFDPGLKAFIDVLTTFKLKLETHPSLRQLLEDIATAKFCPDIYCSGHGGWVENTSNYVNFPNATQRIFFYSSFGVKISDGLGVLIESSAFDLQAMCVVTTDGQKEQVAFPKEKYPKAISAANADIKTPNFRLSSDDKIRAFLIESHTGRILPVTETMTLQEIMNKFANRNIHWVACTSIYRYENNVRVPTPISEKYTLTRLVRKRFPNFFLEEQTNGAEEDKQSSALKKAKPNLI